MTKQLAEETAEERHARVTSIEERYTSGVGGPVRRSYERALNDWKYFSERGHLSNLGRFVTRVTDETILECVKFIY